MTSKSNETVTFTLTESSEIYTDKRVVACLYIPNDAAFNSKTLDVYASVDETNFAPIYDNEGDKLVITLGANRVIPLLLNDLSGAVKIKFVASGDLTDKYIIVGMVNVLI